MANARAKAIARLTLKFQLEPEKYIQMSFNHVNPGSDLSEVGNQIASVTQYHGYPCQISTSIG